MTKTRLINAVFFLAILAVLMVMFIVVLPKLSRFAHRPPKIADTPAILTQVQSLAQLVTVKYVMEKVIILEDIQWYGENRVLMVAHANVKAGIDLKEIKEGDIEKTDKKIFIKLPPARVTDTYLDDKRTKVVERTTGLLRSFDKDLEQNARRQAVLDINRAAREAGILKDAEENAKTQLTGFFRAMGFEVEYR